MPTGDRFQSSPDDCTRSFDRAKAIADPLLILILSDIDMPGMTGLEMLKAARPNVPVIMITAYGDDATRAKAIALGASDC
jgi:CheY-like chemotaxis protein